MAVSGVRSSWETTARDSSFASAAARAGCSRRVSWRFSSSVVFSCVRSVVGGLDKIGPPPCRRRRPGKQLHGRQNSFARYQTQFGENAIGGLCLAAAATAHVIQKQRSIFGIDVADQRRVNNSRALAAQQQGAGEINLMNQALSAERDIGDGGKVVKIGVAVARLLQ